MSNVRSHDLCNFLICMMHLWTPIERHYCIRTRRENLGPTHIIGLLGGKQWSLNFYDDRPRAMSHYVLTRRLSHFTGTYSLPSVDHWGFTSIPSRCAPFRSFRIRNESRPQTATVRNFGSSHLHNNEEFFKHTTDRWVYNEEQRKFVR